MTKKYELTTESIVVGDHTLHQIRAIRDFGNIEAGDLGGYIEKEDNLSHDGDCWIRGAVKVYDNARVYGNAYVEDNTSISGNAQVYGSAIVQHAAHIYDNARVYGNAVVSGASVYGHSRIYGHANVRGGRIYGHSRIYGHATVGGVYSNGDGPYIYGYSHIYDNAYVHGDSQIYGRASIHGQAVVHDSIIKDSDITGSCKTSTGEIRRSRIAGSVYVCESTYLTGSDICGDFQIDSGVSFPEDAYIRDAYDYLHLTVSGKMVTAYRGKNNTLKVSVDDLEPCVAEAIRAWARVRGLRKG